jgi:hypothetical protein
MYPHERSLVKRFKSTPFALLGINSDSDKKALRKHMEDENITWRSWWDEGIAGPITTKWNVVTFPAIYIIDSKGVIRFKNNLPPKVMDRVIDQLLKEAGFEAPKDK